jgi:hypothetical protein
VLLLCVFGGGQLCQHGLSLHKLLLVTQGLYSTLNFFDREIDSSEACVHVA